MKNLLSTLIVGSGLILSGCATKAPVKTEAPAPLKAWVHLDSASGSKVEGHIKIEDHHGGVLITGKVTGLKKGLHGFHIHEKGDCSAKDASSAGGHFHLADEQHGAPGEKSAHAGDLGNIEADKDGIAEVSTYAKGLSLGAGDHSIAGLALIVHAGADDLKSQPTGNSGKRVACGVIEVKDSECCGDCEKKKLHCHHHHHHHDDDNAAPAAAPAPAPDAKKTDKQ